MEKNWEKAQKWESDWWGKCLNTLGEEMKQLLYANRMGLEIKHDKYSPYNFDLEGKNILDIGGGPTSLLLKCLNRGENCYVVDPLKVPAWVKQRYKTAGITLLQKPAEEIDITGFDEVWIYNCLQHAQAPAEIVKHALKAGKIVRVFEWVGTKVNEGHPHKFTKKALDEMLGGRGKTEDLEGHNNCWGKCYYGIFPKGKRK